MWIEVNGTRLHAVAVGSGPRTLVATGGWAGSWEMWLDPMQQLSTDWRVIAYDHRGAGESPLDPSTFGDGSILVDDLLAVLDAFDVESCVLAGESQGTVVSMLATLRAPARVDGLVLVASTPRLPTLPDELLQGVADGLRSDPVSTLRGIVETGLPEDADGHLRRWAFDILRRADPAASAALLFTLSGTDLTDRLREITAPAVVIHGELDMIAAPALGHEVAQGLPNAELVMLPGAGHVPTMSRPDDVVAAIRRLESRLR